MRNLLVVGLVLFLALRGSAEGSELGTGGSTGSLKEVLQENGIDESVVLEELSYVDLMHPSIRLNQSKELSIFRDVSFLNIGGHAFRELDFVLDLELLEFLDVSDNLIGDLSPLLASKSLQFVDLSGNPVEITKEEVYQFLKTRKDQILLDLDRYPLPTVTAVGSPLLYDEVSTSYKGKIVSSQPFVLAFSTQFTEDVSVQYCVDTVEMLKVCKDRTIKMTDNTAEFVVEYGERYFEVVLTNDWHSKTYYITLNFELGQETTTTSKPVVVVPEITTAMPSITTAPVTSVPPVTVAPTTTRNPSTTKETISTTTTTTSSTTKQRPTIPNTGDSQSSILIGQIIVMFILLLGVLCRKYLIR